MNVNEACAPTFPGGTIAAACNRQARNGGGFPLPSSSSHTMRFARQAALSLLVHPKLNAHQAPGERFCAGDVAACVLCRFVGLLCFLELGTATPGFPRAVPRQGPTLGCLRCNHDPTIPPPLNCKKAGAELCGTSTQVLRRRERVGLPQRGEVRRKFISRHWHS